MSEVWVSGCFDLLHAGHVEFLRRAAEYGPVVVALGSDSTVEGLKGRPPLFSQAERVFRLKALRCVDDVIVSAGSGAIDFAHDLSKAHPDVLVVNHDGDTAAKRELCEMEGIQYVVLSRTPPEGIRARSSSSICREMGIPYRIDLAGGWLDQPYVSRMCGGPVVVVSLNPTREYMERGGMATSTRNAARELWGDCLPVGDPVRTAEMLFRWDNPPGETPVSGSQDHLGICLPGISCLKYRGRYWPESIDSITSPEMCSWLEDHLRLVELWPRPDGYDPLDGKAISEPDVAQLGGAAHRAWHSIRERDVTGLGEAVLSGFEAQTSMFPRMVNENILSRVSEIKEHAHGWKLTGAGGGGYILMVTDADCGVGERVSIRR